MCVCVYVYVYVYIYIYIYIYIYYMSFEPLHPYILRLFMVWLWFELMIRIVRVKIPDQYKEGGRKEMFYLTTHSIHFIDS